MQVRLDVLVSAIARDAGLDPDRNTQDKQNIIGWINDTRREIYDLPVNLSYLQFSGEIAGVANVTAGTVAATNAAAEVTGTSTSWTSAMAGRYISIGDEQWQRIAYVADTTHLFLESKFAGSTITGSSYKIWKKYYALPAKVSRVTRIVDYTQRVNPLAYYDPQEFNERYGFGDNFAEPLAYTQFSTSDLADGYLGSTVFDPVTATSGSPLLDFPAGSNLIGSVFPGDRMVVSSTALVVDRVLSNTKVAFKGYLGLSSATLSATALSMDRLLVAFYPGLNDTRVYSFDGYAQVHELSNNADLVEKGWYSAVLKGAVSKAFGYVRDPREQAKATEYLFETNKLIRAQSKALNPSPRLKPQIGPRYGNSGTIPQDRDTGY